ncbi:protein disulfide-isomerase precursor [Nowakowskiella sp. JEL0407]|nr:protein disulfide-isomerase precursor [Nowakowskiella sp. JEL0407]
MRFFSTTLLAVAFAALVRADAAAESPAADAADVKSDVVVLTTESFPGFIEKESLSLIEFYAPWCGHCKALAPEYEVAATKLKEINIPIAKVDCTVEKTLCDEQGVKGFPTLKIFRDGKPSEYKGPRKADGIYSIMKKQSLPAVSIVDAAKVDEFIKSEKVVIVGFFSDEKSKDYQEFLKVGNELREDFVSVASFDAAVAKSHEASVPSIVLFKQFDEKKVLFKGDIAKDAVISFVKANSVPLMDEIGPDNYSNYVERGLPIAYFFYSSETERKDIGAEVEKAAAKFKGKVSFVYIDAGKYGGHAAAINLKEKWPAFGIQEPKKDLKYPYDGEISETKLSEYVQNYVDGKVAPSLKSAPVPEKNDEPVYVAVGDIYNDVVLDKTKDVFMELYAPWCGHCQKLAPIWEELATKLKSVTGIRIAKMDATENDLPADSPFRVEGFPTLKLYKAETNEIVDYTGDRSLDDLIKFLKNNAVHGKEISEAKESPAEVTSPAEAEASPAATDKHDEL